MKSPDESKHLSPREIKFSKRGVAASVVLICVGAAWVFSPWPHAMLAGVVFCGAGFALFFSAGYTWGSDNEGPS